MSQTAETPSSRVEPDDVRQQLAGKHACPFCGVIRADPQQPCPRCTMEDTAATRGATRQRIGPWFVLQARNPSAPGMKFATLLQLVKKGHVTPRSIVRGPTSQQLWGFAAKLRGLSREFGLCWHCGESAEPTSLTCGHCGYSQDLPPNPDVLFEPPETTPPDIMADTRLPAADTGMDGGTSLDLQVSDLPVQPAPPVAAPTPAQTPVVRSTPRPAAPVPMPVPSVQVQVPSTLPARRIERPAMMKEEGILTARELAAAFQLDFKPPGEALPPRKGSMLRTIVALIVIAAVAAGITLALRPDWRATVFAAASEKLDGMKAELEKPGNASPPPANIKPQLPPAVVKTQPMIAAPITTPPVVADTPPANTTPPITAPPKPEPAPVVAVAPTPAPAHVFDPAPAAVVTPPPPVVVAPPAPDPTPKPVPNPPSPAPPSPAPVPPARKPAPSDNIDDLTIDQAIERASQWRNLAIDAEAKRDWAGAVAFYEKIEKLPKDAWPSDVEMRLENARKRAGN